MADSATIASPAASTPKNSALLLIFLTIFLDLLGVGILQPVAPYLVARFRNDAAAIGWIATAYALAQFVASPVLGAISDRTGRRRTLLIALLGSAAGYVLFALANSYPMMIVARIVEGITGASITTAQAYIADVTLPKDRAKSFGLIGVAIGLGFVFGPAIGGQLSKINYYAPVWFVAGLSLVNACFGFFFLPESLKDFKKEKLTAHDFNPVARLAGVMNDARLRGMVWAFFIFNLAFSGFTGVFAKYVKEKFERGPSDAGNVLFVVGMVILLVQGGLLRVLPKGLEAMLVKIGFAVATIAFFLVPLVPKVAFGWLFATQALLAFGVALSSPNLRALISNSVTPQEQGRVLGGTQGLMSLTLILGPLAATYMFDHLGFEAPFWLAGAMFAMALGVFLMAKLPPSHHHEEAITQS